MTNWTRATEMIREL